MFLFKSDPLLKIVFVQKRLCLHLSICVEVYFVHIDSYPLLGVKLLKTTITDISELFYILANITRNL